jgi:hypothetical protein
MASPQKTSMLPSNSAATLRTEASSPAPNARTPENTTEIYTYIAKPTPDRAPQVLYNGDRQNARLRLTLETAGPVAISNKQNIYPVLSGKGVLLENGVPLTMTIAKGNRVFVASTAANRIKVEVEPIPWMEQITAIITSIFHKIGVSR